MRKDLRESLDPADLAVVDQIGKLVQVDKNAMQWRDPSTLPNIIQNLRAAGRYRTARLLAAAHLSEFEAGALSLATILRHGHDPELAVRVGKLLEASNEECSAIHPLADNPSPIRPKRSSNQNELSVQIELFQTSEELEPIETKKTKRRARRISPSLSAPANSIKQIELIEPKQASVIHAVSRGGPDTLSSVPVRSPWRDDLLIEGMDNFLRLAKVGSYGNPGPVTKRLGCKKNIFPKLDHENLLPTKRFKTVVDVFGGSLAVIAFLAKTGRIGPETHIITTEMHRQLFNVYRTIRMDIDKLTKWLEQFAAQNSQEFFDQMKGQYNTDQDLEEEVDQTYAAARYIYLLAACFSSTLRENPRTGHINVNSREKYEPGKRIKIYDEENLRMMNVILQNATLINGNYKGFLQALDGNPQDTFVYMDPPYEESSTTAEYGVAPFEAKDQLELVDIFRNLKNRGLLVAMSNSDTPFMNELLEDTAKIHKFKVQDNYAASQQGKRKHAKQRTHRGEIFAMSY